jgi:hypothetical protein
MKKMILMAVLASLAVLSAAPAYAETAAGVTGWLSDFKVRLLKPFNYEKVVVPPVVKTEEPFSAVTNCEFTRELGVGASGTDVAALQFFLGLKLTGVYDETTASALVGFQEKNALAILKPLNLEHGTGYVGKTTLPVLNQTICGLGAKAE